MRIMHSSAGEKKGVFLLVLFLLIGIACSTDTVSHLENEKYRQIAWNDLSDQQKETVIIAVEEAKVNRNATYTRPLNENESEEVRTVSVTFNTEHDAMLGPIVVYIDPETQRVLGQALRY